MRQIRGDQMEARSPEGMMGYNLRLFGIEVCNSAKTNRHARNLKKEAR